MKRKKKLITLLYETAVSYNSVIMGFFFSYLHETKKFSSFHKCIIEAFSMSINSVECGLTSLTLCQTTHFWLLQTFENIAGKGEIARNEQFLLFPHSVFYLYGELSAIFFKFEIVVLKLFQIGSV